MIRLLIVDDRPIVRDGPRGVFAAEPDLRVVGGASDGAEALPRRRGRRRADGPAHARRGRRGGHHAAARGPPPYACWG